MSDTPIVPSMKPAAAQPWYRQHKEALGLPMENDEPERLGQRIVDVLEAGLDVLSSVPPFTWFDDFIGGPR